MVNSLWLFRVNNDVGENGFLMARIGDCWVPRNGDPLAVIVGDNLMYLEVEFIKGDGAVGHFRYKPEGVVGEGGMICEEGRTRTANPFARLWVVNANGDMICAFLRSIDRLIGLFLNKLLEAPK